MRDHTPDFTMRPLGPEHKSLVETTVRQLVGKLAEDDELKGETLLEFWLETPGRKRPRGTYRGGYLMPDSFIHLADYLVAAGGTLQPASAYASKGLDAAWADLFDELIYQIEIFTSHLPSPNGSTLELWAGRRHRPEGEWVYAVDRKVEL